MELELAGARGLSAEWAQAKGWVAASPQAPALGFDWPQPMKIWELPVLGKVKGSV